MVIETTVAWYFASVKLQQQDLLEQSIKGNLKTLCEFLVTTIVRHIQKYSVKLRISETFITAMKAEPNTVKTDSAGVLRVFDHFITIEDDKININALKYVKTMVQTPNSNRQTWLKICVSREIIAGLQSALIKCGNKTIIRKSLEIAINVQE